MKKIINDLKIEYCDEGSGPTILFLHGWGSNKQSFNFLARKLKKEHRVVRMDLPGFGKSQIPPKNWFLDDYINLVKEFIEKLDLEIDTLIGHSFGGRIIIKGNSEKILQANRNVLIGAEGVKTNKNKIKTKFIKKISKIGKLILLIPPFIFWKGKIRRYFYSKIGSDYMNAGEMKQIYLNIIEEDLEIHAQKITTPTLLIWGQDDQITPISKGRKLSRLIENSKLKTIEDSGHFIHEDKPEEVLKSIKKFYENT
ncbi:MAG: alpha/beta fold hydrolase [Candidatus Magasanikbacteria bacterium]